MIGIYIKNIQRGLIELNPLMSNWKKADFLFFFAFIPSLLIALYLLPLTTKESLALDPSNPTVLSMFFSNYIHLDFKHFFGNFASYLVVMFLIFNIESNKKIFYWTSLTLFILLPFIASLSNILFTPYLPMITGFSAIVAGFVGYLLYAAYNYLKNTSTYMEGEFLTLLFLLNLSIVGIFNLNTPMSIKSGLAIISAMFLYKNITPIIQISKQFHYDLNVLLATNPLVGMYRFLIFMLVLVFIFSLPKLIPAVIAKGTIQINILAHYLGYVFGVAAPLIIEKKLQFQRIPQEIPGSFHDDLY